MRTIPADKANHFVMGAAAALIGLWFGVLVAAGACLGAAVCREIYNRERGGTFDWLDIAWTAGGGAVVVIAAMLGP